MNKSGIALVFLLTLVTLSGCIGQEEEPTGPVFPDTVKIGIVIYTPTLVLPLSTNVGQQGEKFNV